MRCNGSYLWSLYGSNFGEDRSVYVPLVLEKANVYNFCAEFVINGDRSRAICDKIVPCNCCGRDIIKSVRYFAFYDRSIEIKLRMSLSFETLMSIKTAKTPSS